MNNLQGILKILTKQFLCLFKRKQRRLFLNEIKKNVDWEIGNYTYGVPIIRAWDENKGIMRSGKCREKRCRLGSGHGGYCIDKVTEKKFVSFRK